jgi:hypothetical protein
VKPETRQTKHNPFLQQRSFVERLVNHEKRSQWNLSRPSKTARATGRMTKSGKGVIQCSHRAIAAFLKVPVRHETLAENTFQG